MNKVGREKLIKNGFKLIKNDVFLYNNDIFITIIGNRCFSIGGIRRHDGIIYEYDSVDDIINMIVPELRSIKLNKLLNE